MGANTLTGLEGCQYSDSEMTQFRWGSALIGTFRFLNGENNNLKYFDQWALTHYVVSFEIRIYKKFIASLLYGNEKQIRDFWDNFKKFKQSW